MDTLTDLVLRYGLLLLFANVLLEQLGAPIPAVPMLVVAGALVADGKMSAPAAFATAVLASLLGDLVWFGLGRSYGRRILSLLCRISLSPDSCVRRTDRVFERWGAASLVVAKFVPGLSTVAPPLAGAAGMGLLRFTVLAFAGAALWSGVALGAGILFHDAIDRVLTALADLGSRTLLLVLGAVAAYMLVKWWQRWRFFRALRLARITVEELEQRLRTEPAPIVVDVRSASNRAQDPRRIPGAVALDLDRFEEEVRGLPEGREIVLYCT
jgi:membrane protein DedA with SNARE-associated domain